MVQDITEEILTQLQGCCRWCLPFPVLYREYVLNIVRIILAAPTKQHVASDRRTGTGRCTHYLKIIEENRYIRETYRTISSSSSEEYERIVQHVLSVIRPPGGVMAQCLVENNEQRRKDTRRPAASPMNRGSVGYIVVTPLPLHRVPGTHCFFYEKKIHILIGGIQYMIKRVLQESGGA